MKIALAHDHLFQIGGAERVLRELSLMYPEAPIHTLICNGAGWRYFSDRHIKTSLLQHMPGGVHWFKWYLGLMPMAWEQFDFSGYDAVISSCSAFVKGIITSPETRHICYCHTPTRYLWSDRVEYIEAIDLPRPVKLYLMQLLSKLRAWDQQVAASRVDTFVANSNFIARRIKEYYNRDSVVIYPPVVTNEFKISDEVEDYYLVVSRLRPYKRVDLVIQAFNQLRLPLIIIGDGEERVRLRHMAKRNITFLGEVTDEVRNKYLARCKAFIHPQEEDFGISAVEAMASGRPVIAYGAGGALETVVRNVTGTFFDEQSWEALAYAVMKFKAKDFDPRVIKQHAATYDVSMFQQQMRTLLQQHTGV